MIALYRAVDRVRDQQTKLVELVTSKLSEASSSLGASAEELSLQDRAEHLGDAYCHTGPQQADFEVTPQPGAIPAIRG